MLRFIKYWLPVIIYAVFMFNISSLPAKNIPGLFLGQDIVFHLGEYAVFALLIKRAIKNYYPEKTAMSCFLWVCFFVILYGISDEFHQSFVAGRTASLFDVAIDGIGAIAGNIFYGKNKPV